MTPTLTDPAAVLPGEADILAAVLAAPADDTPKLVYADWLDDHGDPARAAYLRAFVAALRTGDPLPPAKKLSNGWREVLGVNLVERAQAHGFADRIGALLRLARPGFAVTTAKASDAGLPTGASKFGGAPDLPGEEDWPATDEDAPLAFIGQINLADLGGSAAARDLPPAGLFSVFYDAVEGYVEELDGWRLFHFPDTGALARRDLPAELDEQSRFVPCRLTFAEVLTLPGWDSPWLDELGGIELPHEYFDLAGFGPGTGHRLLGYPTPIQNDVLGKKAVQHLLTIDSDDNPGWMWGDVGSLYLTIPAADLKARRFDGVRCEMQCS